MPASLSSLLLLLSSTYLAAAEPWPYNLPKNQKYWPEHEEIVKRDAHIQRRMEGQPPTGVQKMSGDPGEMFYMHYWQFEDATVEAEQDTATNDYRGRAQAVDADLDEQYTNASLSDNLLPPLLLHSEAHHAERSLLRFLPRNLFDKRAFECPSGTNSCANINRPNSCCPSSESCVIVEDTGLGDVGCCPAGGSCSGGLSTCNTAEGYTSCPESENGGCCIPGFTCQDVGCIMSNTVTVTATPSPTTSTRTGSTAGAGSNTGNGATGTGATGTGATGNGASTTTITESQSAPVSTGHTTSTERSTTTERTTTRESTTPQGTFTCSTGFKSCPASLGGGCCPTDRACGSAECPALSTASSTSSSATGAAPPVRPTSNADSSAVTEGPQSTLTFEGCPTGFYACSAYYPGGCCRVGRDCQPTSCPAVSSTNLVSNGVTIVAQTGASFASQSGSCATGWFSCAASQGGGCCPSGYGCGSSCTRTAATGTASASAVAKEAPSAAPDVEVWGWLLAVVAMGSGIAMMAL